MTENKRLTFETELGISLDKNEDCPTCSICWNCDIKVKDCKYFNDAVEKLAKYEAIGTVEQLKTIFDGFWKLKDLCEEYEKYGLPEDYWKLNEICKEYSAIGTIEEFKALKEKSVAKKPVDKFMYIECPTCGDVEIEGCGYCSVCGQKLDC